MAVYAEVVHYAVSGLYLMAMGLHWVPPAFYASVEAVACCIASAEGLCHEIACFAGQYSHLAASAAVHIGINCLEASANTQRQVLHTQPAAKAPVSALSSITAKE